MRMALAERRVHLGHLAKIDAVAGFEAHRQLAHFEIEHHLRGAGLLAQIPSRSQRRMPREGQLLINRKDAHLVALARLDFRIARQDEGGLAQVGLTRQLLHFVVRQAAGISKNGELVALQRAAGEHVELNKGEGALSHGKSSPHPLSEAARWLVNHRPCEAGMNRLFTMTEATARVRKRRGSGDSPGLQNRRLASSMSMVRSTRTRFRQFHWLQRFWWRSPCLLARDASSWCAPADSWPPAVWRRACRCS